MSITQCLLGVGSVVFVFLPLKMAFQIVKEYRGYEDKIDITNTTPGTLVEPSQNVIINDGERVQHRNGYTLDGQASTALTPIETSYDWQRHVGNTAHLRSYDDELEFRFVASDDTVTWNRLADGFTSVAFNFAEFWDTTELIDELLFVNGTSNIFHWSGGVTTLASITAATITKAGTTTWAQEGFYTAGTRRVIINNIAYTYTGGEGTTTLTGVTPDPTVDNPPAGSVVHQEIRTDANSTITGLPNAFQNDLISGLYNQIYVGSFVDRQVFVSKVNDFTDFSFSATRLVSEGAILTLDTVPVAFIPQEDEMYITGGLRDWYQTFFTLSSDNTAEFLTVRKLKTTAQGAAQSQGFVSKVQNLVIFVSNQPTLESIGPERNFFSPQNTNISDRIKNFFNTADFTNGQVFFFRQDMLIALPVEQKVLIYDMERKFWQPPQVLPIRRFSIIDGELYGHSSQVPETYRLNVGFNDNGAPINAIAAFSYQQYGDRVNKKNQTEFFSEGYITSNTKMTAQLFHDFEGCNGKPSFEIDGSDAQILCSATGDGSLGKQSLGKKSLAGRSTTVSEALPPKFKVINTFAKTDYRELQVRYSSNAVDQRWEILSFGPDVTISTAENFDISK